MGSPRQPSGNTVLVDYGIKQELSDLRAHVSVEGCCVYVYPTTEGIKAIETGRYPKRPAFQGALKTAEGYLVPPKHIARCRCVDVPSVVMEKIAFRPTDQLGVKGQKAVRVVQYLLVNGRFPLWAHPTVVEAADLQVSGVDITVKMKARIQVKCDWSAGDRVGCTGNLFIQIAECNPFRQH